MKIKELVEKYELTEEDFWHHKQSGQWILTHDACEKIANQENIVLVGREIDNSEENLVRYWITMSMQDENGETISVSSIGEADEKNCFSNYKACFAEKRGIDRCILKLIRAYQYGISSEVEADDFAEKPNAYTITDEQKALYQELVNCPPFKTNKQKTNDRWKTFTTFEQAKEVLRIMQNFVDEYKDKHKEKE